MRGVCFVLRLGNAGPTARPKKSCREGGGKWIGPVRKLGGSVPRAHTVLNRDRKGQGMGRFGMFHAHLSVIRVAKLKGKTTCTLNDAGLFDPVRFGILSHMPARALDWLTVTMKKRLGWGMFSRRQST